MLPFVLGQAQMKEITIKGTKQEQAAFSEVYAHYETAKNDLDTRIRDFDKKDNLFRSYIDTTNWPYNAQVFDPRIFTSLYEKTARLLANKPQGRLIPREGGDALGAKINNELLMYQWDDNERVSALPMLAKWALMDQNARKYGASFGLCKWRWERQIIRETDSDGDQAVKGKSIIYYDGPDFEPLNNRDVLANPAYSSVRNWCQVRSYPTFNELEDVNDAARSKPIYKNLDLLKDSLNKLSKDGGDTRETNYQSRNLTIKGLTDWLGKDPTFKTIEVITEYRPDRWITFAPKHGVVLRDIPNPYKHQQIPIILLKYYPIDEDLYGLSEIEPVEKLQRAINALVNQYLDAINMSLYQPLKVNSTGGAVQMHTLEFAPGKKWLMNDPTKDVLPYESSSAGVGEFASTYRFLVGAMQEALGETSAATSNMVPGEASKTATEVKDLAISRSARDNFNLIFLGEGLKKQMMFWHKMNQQYLFSNNSDKQKIIQITGKDAIKYFQGEGLDANALGPEAIDTLADPQTPSSVRPEDLMTPIHPVQIGNETVPKMTVENGGVAHLIIEKEDLAGNYDYIPDMGSMNQLASQEEIQAMHDAIALATSVDPKTGQPSGLAAVMAKEGKKVKGTDLWIDYTEKIGFKDADKYIEEDEQAKQMMEAQQQAQMQQLQMGGVSPNGQGPVNPAGAGTQAPGGMGPGASQMQGMAGMPTPMAAG